MFNTISTTNKATVLGVGTELTTGQITNKNGSWISHEIFNCGLETTAHLVVPDDRTLIVNALHMCATHSDFIFVTGGLGPTSDDFTRDLIGEFTQKKLIFNEEAWGHIQVRLTTRGFTVKDIQRQQCYFPEGSTILKNSQGTAHGFYLTHAYNNTLKHFFILPGPPREIEAIWKDHLSDLIKTLTEKLPKKKILSWDTLGVGESDVAQMVEEQVTQFLDITPRIKRESFDIGYRVHLPYVEVKLTFFEKEETQFQPLIHSINSQLNKITVTKNFDDITQHFARLTQNSDFTFYDFVTGGFLHSRVSPILKNYKNWAFKQAFQSLEADFFDHEDHFLSLIPYQDSDVDFEKCILIASFNQRRITLTLEAPMKSPLMMERRKQYFAEMALIEFTRRLK